MRVHSCSEILDAFVSATARDEEGELGQVTFAVRGAPMSYVRVWGPGQAAEVELITAREPEDKHDQKLNELLARANVQMPVEVQQNSKDFLSDPTPMKGCKASDGEVECYHQVTITAPVPGITQCLNVACLDAEGNEVGGSRDCSIDELKAMKKGDVLRLTASTSEFGVLLSCWRNGAEKLSLNLVLPGSEERPAAASSNEAEPPSLDLTPLQLLARDAVAGESFSIPPEDRWALFPIGTTDCTLSSENGPPVRLDQPSTSDEFERKRLIDNRASIADKYVGKLVKFYALGSLSDGTLRIASEFELELSAYDFRSKQYTMTLRAVDEWPLGGTAPTYGSRTITSERDREVGKVGGKRFSIRSLVSDATYDNTSKIVIPVKVDESEAENWKNSGDVNVLIVQRFAGMGIHKVCKQDCGSILGVYSCDSMNTGFGEHYRATLVGYEIRVNDRVVAQKVPAAAAAK
jgi:hypothetical protein